VRESCELVPPLALVRDAQGVGSRGNALRCTVLCCVRAEGEFGAVLIEENQGQEEQDTHVPLRETGCCSVGERRRARAKLLQF